MIVGIGELVQEHQHVFMFSNILHHEAIDLFGGNLHGVIIAKLAKNVKECALELQQLFSLNLGH